MSKNGPRILCLDDQRENLRLRKIFLEQFGCEVLTVEDAQECLQIAAHEPLDLAILDYHLATEVTGEDVAHDLRAMRPELLLMMLSGDPKIPQSARECVDAVFIKGIDSPAELLSTIQSLLPEYQLKPRRKLMTRDMLEKNLYAGLDETRRH